MSRLEESTSSLNSYTSSQDTKNVTLASYTASMNTFTSSQDTKNVTLASYTASMNTFTASVNGHIADINSKTGSYARIDQANVFVGNQTITGSLFVTQDFIVGGSSSIQTISASRLDIGDNIIELNTAQPFQRFGGIAVADSGSTPKVSGSLLFDSQDNEWIFVHQYISGAAVTSSTVITGPETFNNIGNETHLSENRIPKTKNGFHIYDSNISDDGSNVSINSNTQLTGSLVVSNGITGQINATNGVVSGSIQVLGGTNIVSASTDSSNIDFTITNGNITANLKGGVVSGSSQIDVTQTTGFTSYSSSVSASVTSLSASVAAGNIWQLTGSAYNTINNIEITGSLNVSGTINADNTTVGIPTSNAWQSGLSGSYFNNFTSETNVSEILRFVAGLLSASAPDASPNTRTFSSVTAAAVNTTTGTVTAGSIPQSSTNATITYLNSKGFATAGSTIFSGITPIYTDSTYAVNYTSVAAGSTNVTSSADAQLFGLGLMSNGTPTSFKVSGSITHRFKDNSTKTDTATSSSQNLITQTGAGTTAGVSLAKINTANNAVIPPAYQDGKFGNALTQSIYVTGSTSTVNVAGYYDVTASIKIASGSSGYSTPVTVNSGIFYAPLTQISTNVPANTISSTYTSGSLTAVSRSLSGAPYLSQSTYYVSGSTTGLFNPLYYAGTNLAYQSTSGTGMTQTSGVTTVSTAGGTIQTSNAVYDSTGVTVRATSTIPFETDIVKTNALYTFGSANITNITQTSTSPVSWTAVVNATNKNGSASTYATSTFQYHIPGTFGQPSASGSMAYNTRTQGSDTATNSGSSNLEPFVGENFRMVLNDSSLTFSGTPWTTTFQLNQLGGNDLQVKPGYLVKPGGANGYWLGDPDTSKTYKYYVRRFTTNGATKTSMTLTLGQALVNWTATTNNSIAVALLFQSSKTPTYATARLYDPSDLSNNVIGTQTANTDGMNPFGSNISLYGNTGGSLASTTYTIPLRNADGMTLDATNTSVYVIVRYKGDPTPSTSMTVTFS